MEKIWDVAIIGAGPAGLTASIYMARQGYRTLVLDGGKIGGRALEAHRVENYPGFPDGLTGPELMQLFKKQAEKFGVEFKRETVIGLSDLDDFKMLSTRGGYHQAKVVIVATGIQRKQLSVPGETDFKGRGVSYCAICDGPFFKDKRVAVVGSGHEAVMDSLHLSNLASHVYAIPGSKGYSEMFPEISKLRDHSKITILEGLDVSEIGGGENVSYIQVKGVKTDRIEVEGVFILLEQVSSLGILSDIGINSDEGGCILVDRNQQTNITGIYAAGDCCCNGWQIVTSAGDGAKAALSAMKYLKRVK